MFKNRQKMIFHLIFKVWHTISIKIQYGQFHILDKVTITDQ